MNFELDGVTLTLEDIQEYVRKNNLDFDDYFEQLRSSGMTGDYTKKDEDGRNMYYTRAPIGMNTKASDKGRFVREVGYDYDRSQGIRFEDDSYGKYLDDFAYKYIAPFLRTTEDALKSSQSGEYTDEMNELMMRGGDDDITLEEAQKTIKLLEESSKKQPSAGIKKWSETFEKYKNPIAGFFMATAENPVAAYEATVSSIASQFRAQKDLDLVGVALGAGLTASKLTPGHPVFKIASFFRGYMSTLGGGVEAASKFGELIKEEFDGRIPTEQELMDLVQDEEKFNKFRNKALAKGGTIALVDNIGGALVTKAVAKTAKKGKKVAAAAKGLVGETVVGGGGEALSSVVIGEEISAVDVGLEILGQGGQATLDIGSALLTPGKYQVNSKSATLKEVQRILDTATPEELANIKITVENDKAFEAEVNRKKDQAYLETQIDDVVSDDSDRKQLVDLQTQRIKAEGDSKKTGIFAVPGSKKKLADIDAKIDAIMSKYEGTDRRTKDVRDRKKKAKEVRLARKQILMDKITQGVKSSKTYKNMDIETKEVDTELEARELFEENINKEILTLQEELKNTELSQEERTQIEKELRMAQEAISNIDSKKAEAGLAHGFLLEDAQTGKMTIVINKEKALSDTGGNINVAAHEFLHAVLKRTFGDKSALTPASNLMRFLNKNQQLFGTNFLARLNSYEAGETQNQEVFTLLSDSIVTGDIKYNESFASRLGGFISDFLTAYIPGRKLKFKDGKDVFRFVKNFETQLFYKDINFFVDPII